MNVEYWTSGADVLTGQLAEVANTENTTATSMRAAMISLYRELPHQHARSYRHMFDRLCTGRVPMLFNCAAGKDRTGVAAALILHSLGVPRDTILMDYLLTNEANLSAAVSPRGRYARLSQAAREQLLLASPESLEAMYAELDSSFGGIDGYLERALEVDELKRTALLNLLSKDSLVRVHQATGTTAWRSTRRKLLNSRSRSLGSANGRAHPADQP